MTLQGIWGLVAHEIVVKVQNWTLYLGFDLTFRSELEPGYLDAVGLSIIYFLRPNVTICQPDTSKRAAELYNMNRYPSHEV